MDQRMKFLVEWKAGEESKAELCRRYGVSRRIGYKWAARYEAEGPSGLEERSRAARHHPNQIPPAIVERILAIRYEHPLWGAPKLRAVFAEAYPDLACPAPSTIGEMLHRAGLTRAPKPRRKTPPHTRPLAHADAPNDVVSIDFKGWFVCGDGARVDPLTLVDNNSRYLLCCQIVAGCDYEHVRAVLDRVFRDYGLPRTIRSDNGAPFATTALAGLSRLSIWWLKLGIEVERIEPAKPQQNGRQERFHLTLKQHTANPPEANASAQQRAFERFRREYNEQRPHQALGQRTPASVYAPSPRRYPRPLATMEYRSDWAVRRVHKSGSIDWRGRELYLTRVLWGERVGLEPIADGVYRIWFGGLALGLLDERRGKIAPLPPPRGGGSTAAAPADDAADAAADTKTSFVKP